MRSAITAIHFCLPNKRLTTAELEERFDPKALRSISKMSGIRERRVTEPGQTASDLAYEAAVRLLNERNIDPASIDLLVFVSQTADYQIPATACVLHQRLGLATTCAAFDINLGCSAYPYSLAVVDGMISNGVARRALLLNADALTQVIHPKDRGLVPLHGDGAVATLVEASEGRGAMLGGFLLGTDGTGFSHLVMPASGARNARTEETKREIVDESGSVRTDEHLFMNGPAVFHFSVYKVPEVAKAALSKFGLTIDDLDLVLLHQANKMMMDLIYRALAVPESKRYFYMEEVGNMSGASTPMVLAHAVRSRKLKPGGKVLLLSFGVGLSWGAVLLENSVEEGVLPINAPVDYVPEVL